MSLVQVASEAAFGGTGAGCLSTATQLGCELFLSNGSGVSEVVKRYYTEVHPWFPIIREDMQHFLSLTIPTNLGNHGHLLLSMYLASNPLCEHVNHVAHNPLYLTTKQMFLLMQTSRIGPTRLLQSGLLITVYEFGHGLTENAHHTLSSCLALYKNMVGGRCDREPSSGKDMSEIWGCWQVLVLLDRTINAFMTTQAPFQADPLFWESIYSSSILPTSTSQHRGEGGFLDLGKGTSNFSMLYRVSIIVGDIFEHVA
ncbi:unnamed protein product [Clonostachys solani]|uniref:Transcription factor domain-containing protein n=1 Tax=Clonostachys solani TaxID=160281 RepID=A0A9N9YUP1_9HYPO|nr:unnamed protein product [Clonostachys solani]